MWLYINEWEEWLTHTIKQDIANFSIHIRTRQEMSQVDAHWELIRNQRITRPYRTKYATNN